MPTNNTSRQRPGWLGPAVLACVLVLAAACGPESPTRGPIPRRPLGPGDTSVEPPPRPQYGGVGPKRVSAKPGVDVTRQPLTDAIGPETDEEEAMALRYAERARRELEQGTTTNAFTLLDAAVEHAPDLVAPRVVRAQAFLAQGSTEQARGDLHRAVDLDPSPAWLAEIVAVNGSVFELQGDQDRAVAAYRRALAISSANVTARDALRRLSGQ